MLDPGILGVDIGSVCISAALIDSLGEIRSSDYRFHAGKVRDCLRSMIKEMGPVQVSGVATTSGTPQVLRGARRYDSQVSLIAACRRRFPDLRLRPYETSPGATEWAIARAMEILVPAFEGRTRKDEAIGIAAGMFDAVSITPERRPRVAIFGDLYVRDNDVMNQGLIRAIEDAGGEAITTPYTEYVRIIAESYFRKWALAGVHFRTLNYRALWLLADTMGSRCRVHFERFLDREPEFTDTGSELFIREFGLRPEHAGESFDNLMKIFHLVRVHPGLALFVQASPAFCCPSMVTEAMARDIERLTGVPVVSITYDGTGQYQNEAIVPYIRFAAERAVEPGARPLPLLRAYQGVRGRRKLTVGEG